jgi:hypothetical protein
MERLEVVDAPLNDPARDLLGMANDAQNLAAYIRTIDAPFTLGIYGEWGEGKTTFVNFLRQFLEHPDSTDPQHAVKFVSFTAWPHVTSDAVWRALLIEIAKCVYDVPPPPLAGPTAPVPTELEVRQGGLLAAVGAFLCSDALVLRQPPPEPDPLQEYHDIVARLDKTATTMIGKTARQQVQLNQEALLLGLVKSGMAVLEAVSPLIAGFRRLLGIQTEINLPELFQKEKNQTTRDVIESVEHARQIFRDIFAKAEAGKVRLYVFIDDLDRCLPDVALDILEAIKVFFGDVRCTFIVAADRHLIGEGLRLRYKDLIGGGVEAAEAYFSRKGEEYLEKIIQIEIPVPVNSEDEVHRFISAQFPTWMPATDIIQTAIGANPRRLNPRRLKQYCSQLSYLRLVSESRSSAVGQNGRTAP